MPQNPALDFLDCEFATGKTMRLETYAALRAQILASQPQRREPAPASRPRIETRRTFRGVPGQLERAFEQLNRDGVFHANCRVIEGVASSSATNSHKQAYDPMGCRYSMGCRDSLAIPLLYSHDWSCVIGEVFEIERTPTTVFFKAQVADALLDDVDAIWRRICSGKIFGVSADASYVGDGRHYRADAEVVWHDWTLCEISIVDGIGANPDARILRVSETFGDQETVHRDVRPRPKVVRL